MLHRVRGGFPLNYGREAVCELINKPEKGDWKSCVVSDDSEEHQAQKFREIFEKHDPFLGQDSSDEEEEEEEEKEDTGEKIPIGQKLEALASA